MDLEPPSQLRYSFLFFLPMLAFWNLTGAIILLIFLIVCSGLISGSEVAFFSLSPKCKQSLGQEDSLSTKRINNLIQKPRKLLATILIVNNLVNIAIVIVSDYLLSQYLGMSVFNKLGDYIVEILNVQMFSSATISSFLSFFVSVVLVTFILVLFGEIAPKIYANLNNLSYCRMMSFPLIILNSVFSPLSNIMVNWTKRIEGKVNSQKNYTITNKEDLDKAIEIAVDQKFDHTDHVDILKSILKFGDVSVKQIMRSRVDVVAIDHNTGYLDLLKIIKKEGYSRIPVYQDDFDNIIGILYVKDLLGKTAEKNDFNWQNEIRSQVLYVPESKKIDDLLREFQAKRMHMGIVVDEYGGSAGIVTLEDVMEEVIGEIQDEFDERRELDFIKLSDNSYVFEGKTLINDMCRIIGIDTETFDKVKGDADSLAGLMLELTGFMPKTEGQVIYKNYTFKVISVSKTRIEKINLYISNAKYN